MLIRFEPSGVEVEAHGGQRVLDVCDTLQNAGVPFSCRDANCATCRVRVIEGSDELVDPGPDEVRILRLFGEDPSVTRLACQLVLRPGRSERVVLRVVPDGCGILGR